MQSILAHKKKVGLAGVALAVIGGYYGARKAMPLVEQVLKELQDVMVKQMSREALMTQSLGALASTSAVAAAKFLPVLSGRIDALFPLESLLKRLRALPTGPSPEKKELWNHLKVSALTRIVCASYGAAFLTCVVRVALTVHARHAHRNKSASPEEMSALKTALLEQCMRHVLDAGLPRLASVVSGAVRVEAAEWDPTGGTTLSVAAVDAFFRAVRQRVESPTTSVLRGARGPRALMYSPCPVTEFFIPQMSPPTSTPPAPHAVTAQLNLLWDFAESPAVQAAVRHSFDVSFKATHNAIVRYNFPATQIIPTDLEPVATPAAHIRAMGDAATAVGLETTPPVVHLAKLLPKLRKVEPALLSEDLEAVGHVSTIANAPTLDDFCALLFTRCVGVE